VIETADILPALDLLIGAVIVIAIVLKMGFERAGVPALVGFIALGFLLRVGDDRWDMISDQGQVVFEFLGSIGVITLLFKVGLESDFRGLVEKLPRATPIWIANVALSGLLAYWLTHDLFGVALIPILFVAAALTATSVAVSVVGSTRAAAAPVARSRAVSIECARRIFVVISEPWRTAS
jgi:Kef-type K+ transport system membrane component KefB